MCLSLHRAPVVCAFNAAKKHKQTVASGKGGERTLWCVSLFESKRAVCACVCFLFRVSLVQCCWLCAHCIERLSRNSHQHHHRTYHHQLLLLHNAAVSPLCAFISCMLLFGERESESQNDRNHKHASARRLTLWCV